MTTIYFNNWFSAIYNTIKSIKEEIPEVRVIASSKNGNAVYKEIADEFRTEPLCTEHYAKWALNICSEYNVDIFFVKRGMLEISTCRSEFEKIGTKLVCEDIQTLNELKSKHNTYGLLNGIVTIPPYYVANDYKSVEKYILECLYEYNTCIVKYDEDEGADSFRVINYKAELDTFKHGAPVSRVSMEGLVNSYRLAELSGKAKKLLIMPYLSGPEVSVDCYLARNGYIAIPRFKESGRVQRIIMDEYLIETSIKVGKSFMLKHPYNVQFRYMDGKPVLLEVNTRISGGLQIANCSGINLVKTYIQDVLNMDYVIPKLKEVTVSQVETPVILEEN